MAMIKLDITESDIRALKYALKTCTKYKNITEDLLRIVEYQQNEQADKVKKES